MLRNILVQSLFQMALLTYLLMIGAPHFGVVAESKQHLTVLFNTFVFCQVRSLPPSSPPRFHASLYTLYSLSPPHSLLGKVFNEINARSIDDSVNVFKGLFKNPLFLLIIGFTVVTQYCTCFSASSSCSVSMLPAERAAFPLSQASLNSAATSCAQRD